MDILTECMCKNPDMDILTECMCKNPDVDIHTALFIQMLSICLNYLYEEFIILVAELLKRLVEILLVSGPPSNCHATIT